MVVLGTPLGCEAFVRARGQKRLQEEEQLLNALPTLPDLQCAWLLLYFSAAPRANPLLRAVPPSLVSNYALAHDDAVWKTLLRLLKRTEEETTQAHRDRAQLPCRLGGCGLKCAARTAPAAYWAAWADVLPTLQQRFPEKAAEYVTVLDTGLEDRQCFTEVLAAAQLLHREGFQPPTYRDLADGAKPPNPDPSKVDPGEWRHGWQYFASSAREEHHRRLQVLPRLTRPEQALLRSQAGRNCARALTAVPSDLSLQRTPERFQVTLCRRLRLPLLLTRRRCEGCGAELDPFGDHLAACMRTGRVQARAKPVERAWARVFREAGATTHEQHLLRNTTLPVDPSDNRRIDVLVTGSFLSRPLFCDATLRSPLKGNGEAHPRAAKDDGAVLERAQKDKLDKYWDVEESSLGELVCLGCEVRGRWNEEAHAWVRGLAKEKAKNQHPLLRRSVELAWLDRWWALLGAATQDALAASLLVENGQKLVLDDNTAPEPSMDLLLDGQRWAAETETAESNTYGME